MYKISDLKKLITKKTEGNNKKSIENLVVFLILLIITVIAINTIWGEEGKSNASKEETNSIYKTLAKKSEENITASSNILETEEYNLQEQLEDILSKIEGVGKVKALITYTETSEVIAMYNERYTSSTTEEADSGGRRKNSKRSKHR